MSQQAIVRGSQTAEPTSSAPRHRPAVDIFESKDAFLVLVDVPGVGPDGFDVRLESGRLDLEARQSPPGDGGVPYEPLTFVRAFELPHGIDTAKVNAELSSGVLRLTLPKSDEAKPRQIAVRSA
jgi:HSP20 family molecular chaperone IbpA